MSGCKGRRVRTWRSGDHRNSCERYVMPNPHDIQSFITDRRIQFAVNLANEIAEDDHLATAYDCADKAVHKIFGRWLLDYAGAVKPGWLPVYLRLVGDVEQRMGLHRRRKAWSGPFEAAAAAWPTSLPNSEIGSAPATAAA